GQTPAAPTASRTAAQAPSKVRLVSADEGELESAAPPPIPPLPTLSLDTAIERGLSENPDMIALRQAEGVSEAACGVAATYPFNPWLQTRILPYQRGTEPGISTTFRYFLLQQTVELGHQQQFRKDMAESQLNQVRWNLHNFELLNAAQTTRLYF